MFGGDFHDPTIWIIVAGLLAGLFFLLRELFCWYWKINRILAALERIAENSDRMEARVVAAAARRHA